MRWDKKDSYPVMLSGGQNNESPSHVVLPCIRALFDEPTSALTKPSWCTCSYAKSAHDRDEYDHRYLRNGFAREVADRIILWLTEKF